MQSLEDTVLSVELSATIGGMYKHMLQLAIVVVIGDLPQLQTKQSFLYCFFVWTTAICLIVHVLNT